MLFCAYDVHDGQGATAPLTDACTKAMANAAIDSAYKVSPKQAPDRKAAKNGSDQPQSKKASEQTQSLPPIETVSLGDVIAVKLSGLEELRSKCTGVPIVLYINSYPIKSLKPYPPSPPPDELRFILRVDNKSRESWAPILGEPCCRARVISVSAGLEDQYPLRAAGGRELPSFKLDILGNRWFLIWGLIFLAMVVAFFYCVRYTNIIRNGSPTGGAQGITDDGTLIASAAGVGGTYSLAKTQGAWWFFIIVAAYLLIGLVTGDFSNSINDTALILLGIGAGTVIGSAVIDQSKDTQNTAKTESDIAAAKKELNDIDEAIAAKEKTLNGTPKPPDEDRIRRDIESLRAAKTKVISDYRKLTRQNENFLTDIMSDANGVSFHRFQMAAWTLVLGIVFIKGVNDNLAMPEFNATLMGLLGLSAGTYLGLKIPEATTPKK